MILGAPDIAHSRWQRWTTDMQIIVHDAASLPLARREVDAELDAIEAAASRFRPDSEIMALAASAGRPIEVSEVLANLLDAALSAARQTDGDVDPTVGAALVGLGYHRDVTTPHHMDPGTVSILAPAVWSMVTLADRVVTVPPGTLLDLGATAKAVAADQCAERVHEV
ncbi:MAG: rane-associated lipoprotein involved in thiamine biosynthesis, partial [Mycobacterium sp.]|nr:rane-associated lipoprotein involved in thiamine biosynthesis [Mycobacterium sp.]